MQNSLSFIHELGQNNNREWFHANRDRYEEARKEFRAFVERLIGGLELIDPDLGPVQAGNAIFRIHRDIRFTNDKSPYKTNFGAFIVRGGKKSGNAGYYFHLEPGNSFTGGGVYHPMPDILKAIRKEIYENAEEFLGIIKNREFHDFFGNLYDDDMLKTPPRNFPADFRYIDLLKYKSYTVLRNFDDSLVRGSGLYEETIRAFRLMVPFNRFINNALSD